MYTCVTGTFNNIEHVFMVGGAGGVPHYTDYYKHVRLGDVVMSAPNDKGNVYVFCEKVCIDVSHSWVAFGSLVCCRLISNIQFFDALSNNVLQFLLVFDRSGTMTG